MAANIKDKLITAEALKAKHDYDEETYLKQETFNDTISGISGEIDKKADAGHNHDSKYATPTYADKAAEDAAKAVKEDLLNGAGTAYDTLKELGELIDDNTDAIDALNKVASDKADKDHTHTEYADADHGHDDYLPLSGGNLTGTLGIGIKYELPSVYHYGNGCLIEIGPSASSTMVAIHIVGNSYAQGVVPINSIFQFYDFGSGALIQYSGVNFGYELGNMIAYRHNGKLYAYIKQIHDYQTLSFTILTNKTGLSPTISNSAAHNAEECTDLITITPTNYYTEVEIDNKVNALNNAINGKASASHAHDDKYYTETEINTKVDEINQAISGKANSGHTHTSADVTKMTSYSKASAVSAISTSDTLNQAIGKLEKALDGKQASGSYAAASHNHNDTYYTESEIDTKLAGKANSSHGNHVPTTETANNAKFLRNDNTWATVTPANIGAAASSHTHTKSQITDFAHNHNDIYYTEAEIDAKVEELNTAISGKAATGHGHAISDVTDLQTALDGKAASTHTHKYAGSSSAGGAATSANKVNKSLTVKLNSGTTEGTNLFTFNGSAAKSIDITPANIGAAASSHNHDDRYYTESEVDTKLAGKANSSHTHAVSDITSGILPIARGGTGATTAAGARTNLGVYSISEVETALSTSLNSRITMLQPPQGYGSDTTFGSIEDALGAMVAGGYNSGLYLMIVDLCEGSDKVLINWCGACQEGLVITNEEVFYACNTSDGWALKGLQERMWALEDIAQPKFTLFSTPLNFSGQITVTTNTEDETFDLLMGYDKYPPLVGDFVQDANEDLFVVTASNETYYNEETNLPEVDLELLRLTHNNLQNGVEGFYSIQQKGYNTSPDAQNGGDNLSLGETSATFGDSNTNEGKSSVVGGSCNNELDTAGFSLIGGCWNQNEAPNTIMGGFSNHNQPEGRNSLIIGRNNRNSNGEGVIIAGYNNENYSSNTCLIGRNNYIEGRDSLVIGADNKLGYNLTGDAYSVGCAIVGGFENTVEGPAGITAGTGCENNHYRTVVCGDHLGSTRHDQAVFGYYNDRTTDPSHVLLAVGNGTENSPNNAFTVRDTGSVTIDGSAYIGGDIKVDGNINAVRNATIRHNCKIQHQAKNNTQIDKPGLYMVAWKDTTTGGTYWKCGFMPIMFGEAAICSTNPNIIYDGSILKTRNSATYDIVLWKLWETESGQALNVGSADSGLYHTITPSGTI